MLQICLKVRHRESKCDEMFYLEKYNRELGETHDRAGISHVLQQAAIVTECSAISGCSLAIEPRPSGSVLKSAIVLVRRIETLSVILRDHE